MLLRHERPNIEFEQNTTINMQNKDMMMNPMNAPMSCAPMSCAPIYECPQERVCHTETVINVPHIIPVNTRIINHQIYKHTYTPCYTECYETEVSNVYDNNSCM